MSISISKLRSDIYNILDRVIATGVPVLIRRKGKTLRIELEGPTDKLTPLKNLPKRDIVNCDPESLVEMDWSTEWHDDLS